MYQSLVQVWNEELWWAVYSQQHPSPTRIWPTRFECEKRLGFLDCWRNFAAKLLPATVQHVSTCIFTLYQAKATNTFTFRSFLLLDHKILSSQEIDGMIDFWKCDKNFPLATGRQRFKSKCGGGWIILFGERPGQSGGVYRQTCAAHKDTDWYILIESGLYLTRIQIDTFCLNFYTLWNGSSVFLTQYSFWWTAEQVR